MSALLSDLVATGTINGLDGDDERLAKLERASAALAEQLKQKPPLLIRAILAGLDPDIPDIDPAIVLAEEALTVEWKTMASVFTDKPIGWLRAILLGACLDVAQGNLATVLWLTAADATPHMRLGREEDTIRNALVGLAKVSERHALDQRSSHTPSSPRDVAISAPAPLKSPSAPVVEEEEFLLRLGAAAGKQINGQTLDNPNPYTTNSHHQWAEQFVVRAAPFLVERFDGLAAELTKQQATSIKQSNNHLKALVESLQNALTNQRRWVHEALKGAAARQRVEQLRLDALWWAEAMYSPSHRRGYRELPSYFASAVMAFDLLDCLTIPTPASVDYLLTETVARLPDCGHDSKRKLSVVLGALHDARDRLPSGWTDGLVDPPAEGRLSIRDLVVLALGAQTWSADSALERAGLPTDTEMTLPDLARAVFRQEQAVRLAWRAQ